MILRIEQKHIFFVGPRERANSRLITRDVEEFLDARKTFFYSDNKRYDRLNGIKVSEKEKERGKISSRCEGSARSRKV